MDGISLHLLAYLFDPEEPALLTERELVRDDRVPRARAMVGKLRELGVPVTWEQVARIAGDGSVGRPHVAEALVELGVVPDVSGAFTPEWLADGGRAHVGKHELDPVEAIRLVKAAGGVTVFAHPSPSSAAGCSRRPRSPGSPRPVSTASRWTTWTTTRRPGRGCAGSPRSWAC